MACYGKSFPKADGLFELLLSLGKELSDTCSAMQQLFCMLLSGKFSFQCKLRHECLSYEPPVKESQAEAYRA